MGYRDSKKHPEWFIKWQLKFYNGKRWKRIRNEVREANKMRCKQCKQLIKGIPIVDHIIEINTSNYQDNEILFGKDNLQLLCLTCHNAKTFGVPMAFTPDNNRNVNLF